MTKIRQIISTYTSTRIFSLLLLLIVSATTHAQSKMFRMEKDSIPLFRGFAVSFDLVGPMMMALSDHGEIEGALRINLHDQWFPVGMDWNIMKNKHADNRLYAGFRYGFTSYKLDIIREALPDPVWKNTSGFGKKDMGCSMHWLEAVFGIDAKIFGPLHLGWMVRYKRRIAHNDGDLGATWYVPGFGINDNDTFGANFNVIVDI